MTELKYYNDMHRDEKNKRQIGTGIHSNKNLSFSKFTSDQKFPDKLVEQISLAF